MDIVSPMAPAATGRCRCHGLKQNYHTRCPLIPVASGVASGTGSALPPSKVAFFTARCCIGHRGHMGLDSPITIRGKPLLESPGHRAGGAAGHQHGWSNKGVPHRLRPGGPLHRLSYRPGTPLEEILRTIASSSRRPVGATGAVGVHAAQACSYCRTVPSAEIPCCPRCRHLQVSSWLSS